jgi:putative transposase
VSGMLKNHCLAQAISDLGLAEWRRQMEYKGAWYGCRIVTADRFYASSKTCHVCGRINKDLVLADRKWACSCGQVHDRDYNASKNLEAVAVSAPETLNVCEGRGPLAGHSTGKVASVQQTSNMELEVI